MTRQRSYLLPALVAVLLAVTVGVASAAKAGTQVFQGLVRHVSTTNLKVYDPRTKQTQSFVIVPRFGNVFKADGTTAAQMKDIATGQYVKVYYDQKAFGAFHADRILIMSNANQAMSTKKS